MVHSIHPRTIQEVKEKADIVDVISEHIVLKKKGKEFVGICPFHDDTKPSMTVSPSKQFYYCFSCCLLYTSPSPRDISGSRMPSSA